MPVARVVRHVSDQRLVATHHRLGECRLHPRPPTVDGIGRCSALSRHVALHLIQDIVRPVGHEAAPEGKVEQEVCHLLAKQDAGIEESRKGHALHLR